MSHSVTMDTTRSPSKDSKMSNSGIRIYKTFPVILKLVQVVVSLTCVGIAGADFMANFQLLAIGSSTVVLKENFEPGAIGLLPVLLKPQHKHLADGNDQLICRMLYVGVASVFLVFSLIVIACFPTSLYFGTIKSRIISSFDHLFGFALHLTVSLTLRRRINELGENFLGPKKMKTLVILGIINSVLYLIIAITVLWSFRRNKSSEHQKLPVTALRNVSLQPLSKS